MLLVIYKSYKSIFYYYLPQTIAVFFFRVEEQ